MQNRDQGLGVSDSKGLLCKNGLVGFCAGADCPEDEAQATVLKNGGGGPRKDHGCASTIA